MRYKNAMGPYHINHSQNGIKWGKGGAKKIKEVQKGLFARASQISRETHNNDNVISLKAPTMPGTRTVINALEILSNLTS